MCLSHMRRGSEWKGRVLFCGECNVLRRKEYSQWGKVMSWKKNSLIFKAWMVLGMSNSRITDTYEIFFI